MKKILFVLSSSDLIYGACKSIQLVLENISLDFDLMYPNSLFHKVSEEKIRGWVNNTHLKNVYRYFLPFEHYSLGYDKERGIQKILWMFRNNLWRLDYHKIIGIVEANNYSVIHLNCNTLAPLLKIKAKVVIHIREVLDKERKNSKYFLKMLNYASGIIYIDPIVHKEIGEHYKNELILENPIDMTGLQTIREKEVLEKLGLEDGFTNKVVFAIIGSLRPIKGVRKVLNAFLKCKNKDIRLLVAGGGKGNYAQECRELCQSDDRITYLGELSDASIVYKISDYIIRGEDFFAVGRTVYEGLYSGCGVILPGTLENAEYIYEYYKFADDIFFYYPDNEWELTNLFIKLSTQKKRTKKYISNIDIYMDQFIDFIKKIEGK